MAAEGEEQQLQQQQEQEPPTQEQQQQRSGKNRRPNGARKSVAVDTILIGDQENLSKRKKKAATDKQQKPGSPTAAATTRLKKSPSAKAKSTRNISNSNSNNNNGWVNVNVFSEWIRGMASEPMQQDSKPSPPRVSLLALLSYSTTREKWYMIFGLLCAAITGMCLPVWLITLAHALDTFSDLAILIELDIPVYDLLQQELLNLVITFAVLGGVALIFGFAYVAIWTVTGQAQSQRIKEQYVHAALKQDAEWFDLNNRDEMPTSIANSMIHIHAALGRQTADLFANFVSSMGSLAVAFILNTPLALVMLCFLPIIAIFILIMGCYLRKKSRNASLSFVAAGALATEVISGIKTISSLCAEHWALTTYSQHVDNGQLNAISSGTMTSALAGITGATFYVAYCVAFWLGTYQVQEAMQWSVMVSCWLPGQDEDNRNCDISGASVMCCIYGVILCATFFGLMTPGLNAINMGRQAAANVFCTMKRIPSIDASSELGIKLAPEKVQGHVEFQKLFFAYPSRPKKLIFTNFNLDITAGSSVAFVGPSGSGKSTVAKLLMRFYDPLSGSVLLDGVAIDSLNLAWYRSQIGYVAQTPTLFPGTIRENIACGKPISSSSSLDGTTTPAATDEEVFAAAKAASAHEFILQLPDGYNTFYSGTSIQLSGGQLQRLCIARAMIRNPTILVLDEATSALDTNSERQVQEAIDHIRQMKQVTTISIAHRLSTIVNSDTIAVISDGEIAEVGNHKSLFEQGGIYTMLCESQNITATSTFESTTLPSNQPLDNASNKSTSGGTNANQKGNGDIEMGLDGNTSTPPGEPVTVDIEEQEEDTSGNGRRLWKLNSPEWLYLLFGTLGACMLGALPAVEAIVTARIVVNFYTVPSAELMDETLTEILSFLGLGLASLVGNLLMGIGFSTAGNRLTGRIRRVVFESILRRNMGWFDEPEHSVGELTSRLEADAESIAKVTGWSLGYRVRVFASLAAGVTVALVFSYQIGLVAIACVPLIMGAALFQKCCMKPTSYATAEGELSPESIFEQGLRGIDSVQSYGLQGKVCNDYSKALAPQAKDNVRSGLVAGVSYGLSQFAIFGSFAIVFYVASMLLVEVKIGFQDFFTSVLAVMFGALAIAQVNADFNAQQEGLLAANRVFELIDEPLDDKDPFNDQGERPESLNGAVTFKSLSFAYPTRPNNPVYYPSATNNGDGFSLSIEPKETVAFVGASGCGKSTSLQILLRFYDASSGEVLVDGQNVEQLNLSWLRNQIGYVGQQPVLFAGSIRDNILLGNRNASEAEIVEAAKAANAHDFVMSLKDGYNSDIGSGGSLLSGGQRQRIAIARAIVSNPPMMVLDEATAALDNESEHIVQAALDRLRELQPRTTLTVAHRLNTVKNSDKIAVLGHGGVEELGSHAELLAKKGLYYDLWQKQGASESEDGKDQSWKGSVTLGGDKDEVDLVVSE